MNNKNEWLREFVPAPARAENCFNCRNFWTEEYIEAQNIRYEKLQEKLNNIKDEIEKDENYINNLSNDKLLEILLDTNMIINFNHVSEDLVTKELCYNFISKYNRLVNLLDIPTKFIDKDILLKIDPFYSCRTDETVIEKVREKVSGVINENNCNELFSKNPFLILIFPEEFISKDMVIYFVQNKYFTNISRFFKYLPIKFTDDIIDNMDIDGVFELPKHFYNKRLLDRLINEYQPYYEIYLKLFPKELIDREVLEKILKNKITHLKGEIKNDSK